MKDFLIWVVASIGAVFGMHSQPVTPSVDTPVQIVQTHSNTPDTLSITDPKDVTDFNTCMSYAKNIPTNFDIIFAHGSDIQEVTNFETDFHRAYPRAQLKVSTEQDQLDEAVAYNGGGIKTASALADYKRQITPQLTSKISVSIPLQDLGTKKSFDDFVSTTLSRYPQAKFQQYAGSSPETFLSDSSVSVGEAQYVYQQQCVYKYKTLSSSNRATQDLKDTDTKIQLMIMSTSAKALTYYQNHNSYASGPLTLNNGICSDTGVWGLKKTVDSIRDIAGSVYCYASPTAYAVSAPLKSDPTTGYCADYTSFSGKTQSPTAASKGYCLTPPKQISQDIIACKNKETARERWICVGNMVDPFPNHISAVVMPFATPVTDKINFCKTYDGVEADYCYSSIVKAGYGLNVNGSPDATAVCTMVSNQNPWFKNDCEDIN